MLRRLAMVLVYRGLLGALFAALPFSPPVQAQSKAASAELAAATSPNPQESAGQPRTDGVTSKAAADLLGLIKQIKPLGVTVPYIDFHDHALAAQTQLQRMRHGAGLRRLMRGRPSYDASDSWSDTQPSNRGGRTDLSGLGGGASSEGARNSSQRR